MNKREYQEKLLSLCTDKQKNLFGRMYPNGPSIKQLGTAINQIERTLSDLNATNEELVLERKVLALLKESSATENRKLLIDIKKLTEEANRKELEPQELTDEDQEDLQMFHALKAAGVDNWAGYDHAQEIVDEWKDQQPSSHH